MVAAEELWSRASRRRWWQRAIQVAPIRLVLGLLFLAPIAGASAASGALPTGASRVIAQLAMTVSLLGMLAAFAYVIESRRARELSLVGAPLEALAGFAIGVALMAATTGGLVLLGAYRVETGGSARALAGGVVVFLAPSLVEELVMRALFFKIIEEAIGSWSAMVLQAGLFGALHLGNPGASAFGAIAIALEAGVLLAAVYMYTRRLWAAWALHFGWNWAQGSLFGIAVSGTKGHGSWLLAKPLGSPWLSGGDFGVEASPVAVVLCMIASAFILREAVGRGQLVRYRSQRDRVRALLSA